MNQPNRVCDLRNMGVLVTRPKEQAEPLCRWIEANDGRAVRFPAIEIRGLNNPDAEAELADARRFYLLIFVSTNAVRFALPSLTVDRGLPVAAVGRATASALVDAGFTKVLVPKSADSEGILKMGETATVDGREILIIRGRGGREHLAETLQSRGAKVIYAEVYERSLPQTDRRDLPEVWSENVQAITVTSGEMLENLLKLLGRERRILETPVIVPGQRVAKLASEHGFNTVIAADGANEAALVESLCQFVQENQQ